MHSIDQFVEIDTFIEGIADPIEMSTSSGLQNLIEAHLADSFRTLHGQAPHMTKHFQIKSGDVYNIQPSAWSTAFGEKQQIELGEYYGCPYVVTDITIEYLTTNLRQNLPSPLIILKITMRPS